MIERYFQNSVDVDWVPDIHYYVYYGGGAFISSDRIIHALSWTEYRNLSAVSEMVQAFQITLAYTTTQPECL